MIADLALPEELKRDIDLAAAILRKEGCREVYLFGSLARGEYSDDSDIDIATVGLPKHRFFKAYGQLLSAVRRTVDLVALDYDQDFGRKLEESGALTRVA
jgi:predicted nucleotidyltransferase